MAGALALSQLAAAGVRAPWRSLAVVAALGLAAALLVRGFARLPIADSGLAIDWKHIWSGTRHFSAHYGLTELRTPPWALPFLWPLSLLPLASSWALLGLLCLCVLALCVPRTGRLRWAAGVLLLCSSYPALRQLADGNLELLVIGGILLLLAAARRYNAWLLAAGVLLASAKIQETWLFLLVYGWQTLRSWPRRPLLQAAGQVLALALPLLAWKGSEWWLAMRTFPWGGTLIDSSLAAVSGRHAAWLLWLLWPAVLAITLAALWRSGVHKASMLTQLQAGALVAAGLLLAPYAASNSVLTPLALAGSALWAARPALGVLLFAAANIPYGLMGNLQWRLTQESDYWCAVLLLILLLSLSSVQATRNVSAKS